MLRAKGRRSLEAALRDLEADKPDHRVAAARDLARHHDTDSELVRGALRSVLGDPHPHVRAAAALALADVEATDAVGALIEACDDDHEHVQQMVIAALGELGAEAAHDTIAAHLAHESPPVRFQAVMAFPRVCRDRRRAVAALMAATEDDDPLIRHIALRMAEEMGADGEGVVDEAFVARAKELLEDGSDVVRVAAAVVLGRCGRRDGARVLCGVAARSIITSELDDEAAALELCGELGLSAAKSALERRGFGRVLLFTRDPFAWQARVALAALGHPRAKKWIVDELGSWTRERRSLAVAAAGRARLTEARELVEAMRGDDSRADQHAVEEALTLIDAHLEETA